MIYLDNAAGMQPYQEVIDVMCEVMKSTWGNPSADYSFGKKSLDIIERVREQIAEDINCSPEEIIFTSGACEANSLAIIGSACRYYTWFYTSELEHTSINSIVEHCNNMEFVYSYVNNDKHGAISLQNLKLQLDKNQNNLHKPLVSISFANGEIGSIQNIKAISQIVNNYEGILHVDATQLYPERKIDVQKFGIDMMSVSAQKFGGPRGIGFLYVKNGIDLEPIIYGSQENGLRAGTYNTAAIAGMGEALKITRDFNRRGSVEYVQALRDMMLQELLKTPGVHLNGPNPGENRLANNINLTIDSVNADHLVAMCDEQGIVIAKGSACKSYESTPSKALLAIGLTEEDALSTIRITLNVTNTKEEIDSVCDILPKIIERLRQVAD